MQYVGIGDPQHKAFTFAEFLHETAAAYQLLVMREGIDDPHIGQNIYYSAVLPVYAWMWSSTILTYRFARYISQYLRFSVGGSFLCTLGDRRAPCTARFMLSREVIHHHHVSIAHLDVHCRLWGSTIPTYRFLHSKWSQHVNRTTACCA